MDTLPMILLLFCCVLAVFKTTTAQINANCVLNYEDGETVSNDDMLGGIDLTDRMTPLPDVTEGGKIFYTFTVSNMQSATVTNDSATTDIGKYFTASVSGSSFMLSTSSYFPTIEDNISVRNPKFAIDLVCSQGTTNIQVQVILNDTNNHPPKFDSTSYQINLPMPYPNTLQVTPLMQQITVTDADMSSQGITMSLDSTGQEYLSVTHTEIDSKTFSVNLTAIKKMELTESLTFNLIATDKGTLDDTSTLHTSVAVTIIPNVEESTYEPKFVEPLYTATVTEASGSLKFNEGDIQLSGLGTGTTSFTLTNPIGDYDYSSYISCESDSSNTATVICSWIENIDASELLQEDYALIKVMGKQGDYPESYTVIHLALPGPPATTTTTSTTVTTTTPEPCLSTTVCPECPTTEMVTECDCTTASTDEVTCPTFDPTTMCPTDNTSPSTDECICSTSDPTIATSTDSGDTNSPSTDSCTCPTFDPTTMCPSWTSDGDTTSPYTTDPTNTDPVTSNTDTTCPTFDPTTMCPTGESSTSTTDSCNCLTSEPTTVYSTSTDGGETTSTDTSCPTFDPTTMCPTASGTEESTSSSSTDGCQCSTFDPTTMCPSSASTDETVSITDCPIVCPSTEITDSSTSTGEVTSSTSTDTCECSCPTSSTEPMPTDPNSSTNSGTISTASGSSTGTGTTSESSTCPVCPSDSSTTSTTVAPVPKLEFEKDDYSVIISSPQPNMVVLRPSLKEEVENVLFSISPLSGTIMELLEINNKTGIVYLQSNPSTGEYNYEIKASVPETEVSGTATLNVIVAGGQVIDDTYVFLTRYMVVKMPEEKQATIPTNFMTTQDTECTFSSVTTPEGDYFTVNSETGNVMLNSVDREATEFNGVEEPAIQLTLTATCSRQDETSSLSRRSRRDSIQYEVNIRNLNSTMDIVVLIQDENDNPPVFTTTTMTIGYPTEELFETLQLSSLGTVEATDADIGDNAKITFGLDEEGAKLFTIHPSTGVLYPRQTSIKDETRVTVTATDGLNEANPSLTLVVRSLEEDHIFEMTVSNKVQEDTDSIVQDLAKQTGMDVRVLNSGVVPIATSSSKKSKRSLLREEDNSSTALRLVLYALEKNEPVEVDDVQEKLGDGNSEWRVTKYDTSVTTRYKSEDTTGYLAGIIVLAVLLVLVLGGVGVAAYLLVIKPRRKTSVIYDPFPRDSKEGTESNLSSVLPTIPPLTEDLLKKNTTTEDVSPAPAIDDNWTLRNYENVLTPGETPDWEAPEVETPTNVQSTDDIYLAPPEEPQGRKRSLTLYSEEELKENAERRDETNDFYDVPDEIKDSEDTGNLNGRRKSVVTFNDNVDTIEIERL